MRMLSVPREGKRWVRSPPRKGSISSFCVCVCVRVCYVCACMSVVCVCVCVCMRVCTWKSNDLEIHILAQTTNTCMQLSLTSAARRVIVLYLPLT